jgi:hypothetical protein
MKFHEFNFHRKVYDPIYIVLRFVSYIMREKCACNSSRARSKQKRDETNTPKFVPNKHRARAGRLGHVVHVKR